MKVRKILKIKDFGQLNNFIWSQDIKDFNKYNFIYGWNYSGKTTLSRIFRCFEKKQLHKDYQNAEFSILIEDDQTLTQKDIHKDYPIRVFNEDFIEKTFNWNNENAEIDPVLILGEELKNLEEQLKEKIKEETEKSEAKDQIEKDRQQKDKELEEKLSSKATEIRRNLLITNPKEFDKNRLKEKIEEIKDNYQEKILPKNDFENLCTFISRKKLDKINTPELPELKLNNFIQDVSNILNKIVTAQQIIEKLKDNPRLSQWIKDGIALHKEEETCQFCGNPLTKERLEELNKHFSKEFDNLMETIKQKENELNEHIDSLNNISLPNEAKFYDELQQNYEEKLNQFQETKQKYINTISKLKEELSRKKEKPFESLVIDKSITSETKKEINNTFGNVIEIIKKHNSETDSINKKKEDAKEKIKLHCCAEFIRDEKYFERQNELTQLKEKIKNLDNEINEIKKEIESIKQRKKPAIGAKVINDYLNEIFGDDRLKVEVTENDTYKLYRNYQIAKTLSTGEKNIISLIYFFAKLEEIDKKDLNNTVIFVDDPVSSLDANHIHRVCSFIYEKVANIGQIFITTHNFDFFNLLKDMYIKNDEGNFYLIKRIKNSGNYYSTIENLPNLILKFKSEYNYLFSILKEFNSLGNKENFDQLFLLPNILRRFFEMYLFMKYPDGKKFKEKASKFLDNSIEKQAALKIMNEHSHEENIEHSLRFPDIQELKDAIEFILNKLKEKDKDHYDALCASLESNKT
jgi:wobble nucleotide-excising tRNase